MSDSSSTLRFKQNVIKAFPNVELSYEKLFHKKVRNFNTLLAIPKGPKYFVWITKYNGNNITFYLRLDKYKKIIEIFFYHYQNNAQSNSHNNGIGTILYGTLFFANTHKCFTMENVLYFNGQNTQFKSWREKFNIFHSLLSHNLQSYHDPKIIVGLPILSNDMTDFISRTRDTFYEIYNIEYRKNDDKNRSIITKMSIIYNQTRVMSSINEKQFIVKPTIQNDIYELFELSDDTKTEVLVDIAHIPDFKTSVMMNSLFRNIKENSNLDALEESDDEDEFQSDSQHFVMMDTSYLMKCTYNRKFNKWQPIGVCK